MVGRAQEIEEADQGDIGSGGANHQTACQDETRNRTKLGEGIEDLAGVIRLTVPKLFPQFNEELGKIPDPRRDHPSKKYPLSFLVWIVMLMFVTQPSSRRQYDLDKKTEAFLLNLLLLSGDENIKKIALAETADDLLQKLDPLYLRTLRKKIVLSLIRSKRLEACKFQGFWRLAIDATGLYTFKHRHCPFCQTRRNKKTGEVTYFHNVLELKLVSPDGLAISLDSEFIVNHDGETKQDSELKAFYRVAPRVKQEWPLMSFLLLGDGIYANANVMRLCGKYGWSYCITLKNNLPTLKAKSEAMLSKASAVSHIPEAGAEQAIRWVDNLWHGDMRCHVLACDETVTEKNGLRKTTTFRWVTNLRPSSKNAVALVNGAGRQRWKIENQGFKTQKCDGYNIEHGYGVTGHAWQNYYLILQIVHTIMQMATRTDAIHKLPSRKELKEAGSPLPLLKIFSSMKNFVKRLAEAFRYCPPTWRDISELGNFQLRYLNSA